MNLFVEIVTEICSYRNRQKLRFESIFLDEILNSVLQSCDLGQFIKSQRGNPQLMDTSGYIYNKTKIRRNLQNWECISRQKLKCHARAQTSGLHIVQIKGEHSHPIPDSHHRLK